MVLLVVAVHQVLVLGLQIDTQEHFHLKEMLVALDIITLLRMEQVVVEEELVPMVIIQQQV